VQGSDIDLTDMRLWTTDPHPAFAWLREHEPVSWRAEGPNPFWAITRFDDISYVNAQPALFSSSPGITIEEIRDDVVGAFEGNLTLMDDPEHRWMRAIASRGFTPNRVRAMEPHIRELAAGILDHAAQLGECDFVEDVALPLPIAVIAELTGLPDRDLARRWSDAITSLGHPDPGVRQRAMDLTMHVSQVLTELAVQRQTEPRNDLLSALVHAEVDGRRLTSAEHLGFMLLLNFGGNETTRSALSSGMLALLANPNQLTRLRREPRLIPSAVEELLRYVTPLTYAARTATQDVELGGRRIKAGDKVVMWFISGNRDVEVFAHPNRLDVGRMPNRQLSFGPGGAHFCLGAAVARLQLRVMLEMLTQRFSEIELTGEVVLQESNFVRGVVSMPVRLRS
jgi:cholest-4-en-3-one 26-monooxygenase